MEPESLVTLKLDEQLSAVNYKITKSWMLRSELPGHPRSNGLHLCHRILLLILLILFLYFLIVVVTVTSFAVFNDALLLPNIPFLFLHSLTQWSV